MRDQPLITLVMVIICVGQSACGSDQPTPSNIPLECAARQLKSEDDRHPDYVRQIVTVGQMRPISQLLDLYRSDHSEFPTTLEQLTGYWGTVPRDWKCDGWGRRFVYFAWKDRYTLASFGRNGLPEVQASVPSRSSLQYVDYDTDIVMMNGEWVQTPESVSQ